jgi:hypothetical protein
MNTASRHAYRAALHASAVVFAYTILFTWLFARPIITHAYLSESDLFEYYLPIFLAPITTWSSFEFSGLPAFADPGDFTSYLPHFFFARIVGSWTGFIVSAFVLGASFTYAFVYRITRSRTAAAFAGLAYGMSEALVERLPHLGTLHCFAWLPLILLAIEGLRGEHRRAWTAIGGLAVASAFLSGHPQPAVYTVYFTALYALVGARAERADRRYFLSVSVMYFIGGLLASIKAIPLVEASFLMARQEVNLGQFTSHGNSPAQMLSTLFPTILHEGREAPTYVGLATLLFAFVGVTLVRRNWRVAFWVCVSIVVLLIGAGQATPVAQLLYNVVPLYQKFRVGARHLFLAAFGAAFLAGYAIAAIQRAQVPTHRVRVAAACLFVLMIAGAAVQAWAPQVFQYEVRAPLPWSMPVWNGGVWIQLALAVITIGAALLVSPGRRFVGAVAVTMAILFADDLYSLPYPVTTMGLVPITIPADAAMPSVHAQRIRLDLAPLRQRALAIGGTQGDDVIPAAFARLWQVPIAGGYGPMLLERYSELATMGTNGSVRPSAIGTSDVALDLLAVRYILVRPDDITEPATFERNGVRWNKNEIGMPVGRPDCGHDYARSTAIPLPADVAVAAISLVTHLRCSEDVLQDAEVARLRIVTPQGVVHEHSLRAGVDTAETGLHDDPALLKRARHQVPVNLFDDPSAAPALRFVTRITLPRVARGGRLELDAPATNGWITIDRLTLIDDTGTSHPLSAPRMWLSDATRWREGQHFTTSRVADRGVDRQTPDEIPYVVMENLRALPRAWVVPEMMALADADALEAIRRSQLPSGARFDPQHTALVAPEEGLPAGPFSPGSVSTQIQQISDGRITVTVSTVGGGFLVLSEVDYPGWRAHIDGTPVPVRRTDVALQGVVVPSGTHTVEFELVSLTQRAGASLSVAGLLICAVLIAWDLRQRAQPAPQNVA